MDFYFLCSVLDGFSRFIVHWEIRQTMEEKEVQTIIQRAREAYPGAKPRIISDNSPQFLAKDFKEFIRICGMTHVRTSPYYPQSNGKIERWHKTLKSECIRPQVPLSDDEARRQVTGYVAHYNNVRLHSAIGYITPKDKLAGRAKEIHDARDRKLAEARERRKAERHSAVIALWLGHESVETTQMYLHADLRQKEEALAKVTPLKVKPGRFRPDDKLLAFLEGL